MLLDSIKYDKLDIAGVKAALDKGANPNWVADTGHGYSVLRRLAQAALFAEADRAEEKSVAILQLLFRAGAKLQPRDQGILSFPVVQGWVLFTEVLLKNGANPTRKIVGWGPKGVTPMELAVSHGQANIVELLRKYGVPALENRVAAQRRFISTAGDKNIFGMEEAIRNGARANDTNRQGETVLITALSFPVFTIETYSTIQYLFEKGADPTIQGEGKFGKTTALHCVIYGSSFVFGKEIKNERLKDSPIYARLIIESLLSRGALVSARDGDGMTPLHIAAKENNIVGAKMLIEAGSKIMPRDDKSKTPLDYAESAEMIKLLKDHGAKEE
jgi:ankyrin repeat protein